MVTIGDSCNFDDLGQLIVIWKMLVPILVGIPATFLIPNTLQTEPLIDWKKEAWYGSEHETTDAASYAEPVKKDATPVSEGQPYFV